MNERMDMEKRLQTLDYDALFPDTPGMIRDAVRLAGEDIRRREARVAKRRAWAAALAAVLVVGVGVAAAAFSLSRSRSDNVAPPSVAANRPAIQQALPDAVFAAKADPCFHIDPDCPKAAKGLVELPAITALAFEKSPCPRCAGIFADAAD